jgi:hypothetical protein
MCSPFGKIVSLRRRRLAMFWCSGGRNGSAEALIQNRETYWRWKENEVSSSLEVSFGRWSDRRWSVAFLTTQLSFELQFRYQSSTITKNPNNFQSKNFTWLETSFASSCHAISIFPSLSASNASKPIIPFQNPLIQVYFFSCWLNSHIFLIWLLNFC